MEQRPFGDYAIVAAAFWAVLALFLLATRIAHRPLPGRIGIADVALVGLASRQAGRLLAKDTVTSFVRAPFVRFLGFSSIPGEVDEVPRGNGIRRVIGELLTNPRSTAQWAAALFVYGLVLWPRPVRLVASIFAAASLADLLQRRWSGNRA